MSKDYELNIEGDKTTLGLDFDNDGESSVGVEIHYAESFDELISIFKKNEKKDVKAVKFEHEGDELKIMLDANKDGENSIVVFIKVTEGLIELFQEIVKKFNK